MKKIISFLVMSVSFAGEAQSFSLYKTDVNFVPTATLSNGNYVYESTSANALKVTKFKITFIAHRIKSFQDILKK